MDYTKGKWGVNEGDFGFTIKSEQSIVNGFNEDVDIEIAETNNYLDNKEEEANAHLIAAAPNLDNALALVIWDLDNLGKVSSLTRKLAEEALSKARVNYEKL